MKTIYILCLAGVRTGGPEALHQLSDALLAQGFPARMVYYTWEEVAALERASPGAGYCFGARSNEVAEYLHYEKMPVSDVPNDEHSVVVLPEPLCHLAPLFNRSTVLIWWLSVDNGFGALSKVNLNHLRAPNVWHATQSEYARRFVNGLQFAWAGELSDYTTDMSKLAKPLEMDERPPLVAFNATAHKVTADLEAIILEVRKLNPAMGFVKIAGMSRSEIAATFSKARVYVDLGNFPGLDRMPREAKALGCHVITAQMGAGAEYEFAQKAPDSPAALAVMIVRTASSNLPTLLMPERFCGDERERFLLETEATFYDIAADTKEPAHAG